MDPCHRRYLDDWRRMSRSALPAVKVTYHIEAAEWELVEDYGRQQRL